MGARRADILVFLGWQFTLAQTAKDAADTRMFPGIFGKASAAGAPVAGMVIMGIVQSVMALSTVSPNLNEQFGKLVNLAVVTNVVPYIVALSALFVMMRKALRLDPKGELSKKLEAEIAYLEGALSVDRGAPDKTAFERALALDPGHAAARQALAALEDKVVERQSQLPRYAAAGSIGLVSLIAMILLIRRRPAKTAAATPPTPPLPE